MYTVEIRMFGRYVEAGYSDTRDGAMQIVREQQNIGWIHTRIVAADGTIEDVQFGEA